MKKTVAFLMTVLLGSCLALAQNGGDKDQLNPQPLPPRQNPGAIPGKKATKTKTHKGGKKSKKAGTTAADTSKKDSTGTGTTAAPK